VIRLSSAEEFRVERELTPFGMDVRTGLTRIGQKALPPKYLYDDMGSALFEAITRLPEYGLYRAERRLLETHAPDIALRTRAKTVVELGSGSASKTGTVLEPLLRQGPIAYFSVELSSAALAMSQRELGALPGLDVHGIEAEYLDGLARATRRRAERGALLVLFLGSSIGNFGLGESANFLRAVRDTLKPGDFLLLGADLRKPAARLITAYADPLGVTAAFNLNLLVRMNRELGTNFELGHFRHSAIYDETSHDVEMHLRSLCAQTITFPAPASLSVFLREGETIHTESSHKYTFSELAELTGGAGFEGAGQWLDAEWGFLSTLYRAA